MADHTPGPWYVEIDEHRAPSHWYAAAIHVGSPFDASHRTVARVSQAEPSWDEAVQAQVEANARLIAAAPDLLAACLAYQDWTDASEIAAISNTMENLDAESQASERFENLREAAIAKARGEASHVGR